MRLIAKIDEWKNSRVGLQGCIPAQGCSPAKHGAAGANYQVGAVVDPAVKHGVVPGSAPPAGDRGRLVQLDPKATPGGRCRGRQAGNAGADDVDGLKRHRQGRAWEEPRPPWPA